MTALPVPLRPLVTHRRPLLAGAAAAACAAAAVRLLPNLPAHTASGHWQTPLPVITLGTITGLSYGLLGVGLVLIYRTSRIINFAHGQIGVLAAALFAIAVIRWHIPYWVALPPGLGAGAAVGMLGEVVAVRLLRRVPRLMSVVATLAFGQVAITFALLINGQVGAGASYPRPAGLPAFTIGPLLVNQAYLGILILAPITVAALAVFLRRSRPGLGIQAASANPEAARMAGVFSARMSSLAWALAGALSALTAILTLPTQAFSSPQTFGPSLLLRALAAAAVARMTSLPTALAAGVGLGIVEQLLLWNYAQSGFVEVMLFAVILLVLAVQRGHGGREDEKGSWSAVQALRPVPAALRRLWLVRNLSALPAVTGLAVAVGILPLLSNSAAVTISGMFALTIVGLSLGVISGLGGQLSLGQFGVAATAAVVSYRVTIHHGNFIFALIYAGLAAAAVSVVLGLPALRSRGLLFTVTTLAFALVVPDWLLAQPWALGNGVAPPVPAPFGHSLATGRSYYLLSLALLLVAFWLARNIRRGGFGRLMIAVRDNEDNARAFTVRAAVVKAQGFALAGFLAGIGGALYAHGLSQINAQSFPTDISINLVVMLVIGGASLLAGPLLGAFLVILLPAFGPSSPLVVFATAFGWLLLVLYLPGGLGSLAEPVRDRIVRWLASHAGIDVAAAYADEQPAGGAPGAVRSLVTALPRARRQRPPGIPLLAARNLVKSFGGVRAVDGASIEVRAGETVGMIGPNGAGKTTTFELLGGFTRPDAGSVWFDGTDVTLLSPEARGRQGLIRSFQDAALFPNLTVEDTLMLALERITPTSFFATAAGLGSRERAKRAEAGEFIHLMGLGPYRRKQIQELSTGTRRITEIACLIATRPSMLLLDEPSSGIAQRETEALGQLLEQIKGQLGVTLLIIEHDIPLIMGLAGRIIAMADGRVIASGRPEQVRAQPVVIEAYFGSDAAAIERSGVVSLERRPASADSDANLRTVGSGNPPPGDPRGNLP